jgi:hypothetical protein
MASTPKCFDMLGMFCGILIVVGLKHWKRIMSDDAIQYGDSLKIINYSLEREMKLIQAFKKIQARRYLLQVVTEHWIKFPYAKISLPIEESLKRTFYN